MTTQPRPNAQALHASRQLEQLATQIANAKQHITHQFVHTDGAPPAQTLTDGSRTTEQTTPVERTVIARQNLQEQLYTLNDSLKAIDDINRFLFTLCRQIIGTRLGKPDVPRCYTDPGLDGYLIPRDEGGWSDPACTSLPRSALGGLCDPCRLRLARYRLAAERPLAPIADERPITHDSTTYTGHLGVTHTRPIRGAA